MKNNIVVIGSNSFSGSSFCKFLLESGFEVTGISRSKQPVKALAPHTWVSGSSIQFKQYDLNHHLDDIETVMDATKPSHVFNFAAQSMVGQSWEYPEHWFNTNVVATVKLHNMLRRKDYLEKYIHVSTPEVYGNCVGNITEDHCFNPSTPYAVSRAAADMSLKTFFDVHQFPVVSTRAANVYGEGQQLYRIIPKTILCALTRKTLPLHGGGHSVRSFIHIDDVSVATLLIAEKGRIGETYHISTPEMISIRALVEAIAQKLAVPFEQFVQVTDDRPGKDASYSLSSEKLITELGWRHQLPLELGLSRTIKWLKNNLEELRQQPDTYIHKA